VSHFAIVLRKVLLSRLPKVPIQIFERATQFIVIFELKKYFFKPGIVFKLFILKLGEVVYFPEVPQHLINVGVVDRIVLLVVVTAELGSEGIEVLVFSCDIDLCYFIYKL
jgi:hypothetical protein